MVGLIPLFAVETLEPRAAANVAGFQRRLKWYLKHRPDLCQLVSHWDVPGVGKRRLLSLLRGHRMKCLADAHAGRDGVPVRLRRAGRLALPPATTPTFLTRTASSSTIDYEPGESTSGMFGGNSNWRGPIWFPVNYLIIESLQKFHHYYGDDFKIECPTGSGKFVTILEVAEELTRRLSRLFLRDAQGRRAVFGHVREISDRPAFPRLHPVPRVFPRRYGARRRRLAPDRLDRADRQVAATQKRSHSQAATPRWLAVPNFPRNDHHEHPQQPAAYRSHDARRPTP